MSPIPPGKASNPASYKNHPWATGPYMFKPGGYLPDKSLVLVKNPYWDPNTDPGRHQYLDEIDFNFTTDNTKIDQTLLADAGTAKTTMSYQQVLTTDYRKVNQGAGDRLILGSRPCTYFWYPDNRKITDINVRRALAYAYPYHAMWTASGQIPGVTRLPATNVMPPGTPARVGYNPLPGHTPGSTDPAKSKALLREAGKLQYVIKFPYVTDDPLSLAAKNVAVRALSAAGFDPQPVGATAATIYAKLQANPQADVNVRSNGWCNDWPSGSGILPAIFHTRDLAAVGSSGNYEAFSSKVVDDRITAISHLLLTEQPAAWNALDKFIQTKYFPVIVTGYGGAAMMRGSKVHNANDDTTFGEPTWKDVWLG
jgi:peptide/nickel transport system substrate-binding protein